MIVHPRIKAALLNKEVIIIRSTKFKCVLNLKIMKLVLIIVTSMT